MSVSRILDFGRRKDRTKHFYVGVEPEVCRNIYRRIQCSWLLHSFHVSNMKAFIPRSSALCSPAIPQHLAHSLYKPHNPRLSISYAPSFPPLLHPSPHPYPPPHLFSPHQNRIKLSPPILSPLFNNVAISTLNGLSTSGYASN